MKFSLGMLCGFILGAIVAMTYVASAQLAPFDAPLGDRLDGQRQENFLKLERELDHLAARPPRSCRR